MKKTRKIITIIRDDHFFGVVYGEKEISENVTEIKHHSQKYMKTNAKIQNMKKKHNTRQK